MLGPLNTLWLLVCLRVFKTSTRSNWALISYLPSELQIATASNVIWCFPSLGWQQVVLRSSVG